MTNFQLKAVEADIKDIQKIDFSNKDKIIYEIDSIENFLYSYKPVDTSESKKLELFKNRLIEIKKSL